MGSDIVLFIVQVPWFCGPGSVVLWFGGEVDLSSLPRVRSWVQVISETMFWVNTTWIAMRTTDSYIDILQPQLAVANDGCQWYCLPMVAANDDCQ